MHIIAELIIIGLYILLLIISILFIVWSISALTHPKSVPFVPTKMRAIKPILAEMNISAGSVVYDHGSGDGRVLFELFKMQLNAQYIGIEKNFFPYLLARARWLQAGRPRAITFIKDDIFKINLSEATHIYTYLLPDFMDLLRPKLQKELKPGTKLISLQFAFTDKKPVKTSHFGPGILGQKSSPIYTYEF